MKAVYDRLRGTAAEDVAVTTHDLWKPGTGNSFSDAERTEACAAYAAFWATIQARISTTVTLREIRCYDGYNGDGTPGEVDYVHTVGGAGSDAQSLLPPQCAIAITERTDARKHWGRFYLPGFTYAQLAADGTVSTACRGAIISAAVILYNRWNAIADCNAIVWGTITATSSFNSPLVPGRPFPSWLYPDPPVVTLVTGAWAVQKLQIDEIWDIIRRRRWQTVLGRSTFDLTA